MLLTAFLTHSESPISIETKLAVSISHHPEASISRMTSLVVKLSSTVQAPGRLPQEDALSSRVALSTSDAVTRNIPSRVTRLRRLMDAGMPTERPSIGTPSEVSMRKAVS